MMSVTITHPVDQTKIRSQTQRVRQGMTATARNTIRESGVRGLWVGLSGSLLRQATYGSARFGLYNELKDRDTRRGKKKTRMGLMKNGAIAGVVAGMVGAPAELVMVRMCSDGVKPPEKRMGYRNAIDGIYRIATEEGVSSLSRGLGATCLRSVLMNSVQLSCYDMIKEALLSTRYFSDTIPTHLLTATLGGTLSVTACARGRDQIPHTVEYATGRGRDGHSKDVPAEGRRRGSLPRLAARLAAHDPYHHANVYVL